MPKVKVWNKNVHPYTEEFQGEKISIPANEFIMMEQEKAELFRGTFNGVLKNGDGGPDPRGFKMIRIEYASSSLPVEAERDENKCIACNYKATGKADLSEHTKAMHAHQVAPVDEDGEAEVAQRKGRKAKTTEAQASS